MAQNIDILIMCGGKSGSSTMYSSFKKAGLRTLKIHSRQDYALQFKQDKLYETIDLSAKNKKLYIIDSYRTPIERKISSFFENIDTHAPRWKNLHINELINIFNNKYLFVLEEYHSLDIPFRHYKIPQFTHFDFNRKYARIDHGNKVFIKLLHKDIAEWRSLFKSILGRDIEMFNENMASKKPYSALYNQFKKQYKVPKSYLHHLMTKDLHFRLFNTVHDQNEYIINWSKKSI